MDRKTHNVPDPHTAFKTIGWVWEHFSFTDKPPHPCGLWNVLYALRAAAGFARMRETGRYFCFLGQPVAEYRCRSPPFLTF